MTELDHYVAVAVEELQHGFLMLVAKHLPLYKDSFVYQNNSSCRLIII